MQAQIDATASAFSTTGSDSPSTISSDSSSTTSSGSAQNSVIEPFEGDGSSPSEVEEYFNTDTFNPDLTGNWFSNPTVLKYKEEQAIAQIGVWCEGIFEALGTLSEKFPLQDIQALKQEQVRGQLLEMWKTVQENIEQCNECVEEAIEINNARTRMPAIFHHMLGLSLGLFALYTAWPAIALAADKLGLLPSTSFNSNNIERIESELGSAALIVSSILAGVIAPFVVVLTLGYKSNLPEYLSHFKGQLQAIQQECSETEEGMTRLFNLIWAQGIEQDEQLEKGVPETAEDLDKRIQQLVVRKDDMMKSNIFENAGNYA